ncbi:hypothetical protein ACPV4A_01240 [Vibrio rotiferianus]|uniref:hypothetical protein n=1 Tax=Vibrio rotiferianus TaxID=190895 RepID=UPI00406AA5C9
MAKKESKIKIGWRFHRKHIKALEQLSQKDDVPMARHVDKALEQYLMSRGMLDSTNID